jgi:hypothetical protein
MTRIQILWQAETWSVHGNELPDSPDEPANFFKEITRTLHEHYHLQGYEVDGDVGTDMVVNYYFQSLEIALEAKPYFEECKTKYRTSGFNMQLSVVIYNLSTSTPLLKYLPYNLDVQCLDNSFFDMFHTNVTNVWGKFMKIRDKYFALYHKGTVPVKKVIWEYQKELIENGFEGNARW